MQLLNNSLNKLNKKNKKMEFKNSQKKIFKTENRQSVPDRLKQKVNEFLEKKGKPKRFDIPDKKDENKQ